MNPPTPNTEPTSSTPLRKAVFGGPCRASILSAACAVVQRAAEKIIERLDSMKARCEKQNRSPLIVSREIGRLLGQNTRASHLFEINVLMKDKKFALQDLRNINAF